MSPDRGENSAFSPPVSAQFTTPPPKLGGHTKGSTTQSAAEIPSGEETTPQTEGTSTFTTEAIIKQDPNSNRSSIRPASLHSSHSSQSRRDSGYSSTKSPQKRNRRASRSSSKQSLPSARDTSISDESTRPPRLGRVISFSRVPPSPRNNIEEALALHERSCRIFPPSSMPPTPILGPANDDPALSALYRSKSSPQVTTQSQVTTQPQSRPSLPPRSRTAPLASGLTDSNDVDDPLPEEEFVPATIMHWTSDETRRKEYAKIDMASKGIRGLLSRLFPRLAMKSKRSRFYDEKDGSRAGSIRRYRLNFDDDEKVDRK
jgi:hypothetical protein